MENNYKKFIIEWLDESFIGIKIQTRNVFYHTTYCISWLFLNYLGERSKKKKKNYIFISQKGFCAFKFELFPTFVKILWVAVFFYGNSVYLSNLYEIKHISKNFKEMFQTFRIEKSTCEIKYFHQMQSPSELFFKIKICALHILA